MADKWMCDCCHVNEAIGAASSGYIPYSFAWCRTCLQHPVHPEPEWVLSYLYYEVGDHGKGLVPDDQLPGTFKDDRYWTWREWADWAATQPDPPRETEDEVVQAGMDRHG
jgi:hypothetical protein